jgi:hypothetical protein
MLRWGATDDEATEPIPVTSACGLTPSCQASVVMGVTEVAADALIRGGSGVRDDSNGRRPPGSLEAVVDDAGPAGRHQRPGASTAPGLLREETRALNVVLEVLHQSEAELRAK